MQPHTTTRTVRDSQTAFADAIRTGRLSDQPHHPRYAGHYMYMHTDSAGSDHFKHIDTRAYLRVDY